MSSTPIDNPTFVSVMVRARTRDRARRIAAHEVRQEGRRIADVSQVTDQGDGRTWLVEFRVQGRAPMATPAT